MSHCIAFVIHANIPSFPTLTSSGNHPAVRKDDVSIRRETQICIVAAENQTRPDFF